MFVSNRDLHLFPTAGQQLTVFRGPTELASQIQGCTLNNYGHLNGCGEIFTAPPTSPHDLREFPLQVRDVVEYRVVTTPAGTKVFLTKIQREGIGDMEPEPAKVDRAVELVDRAVEFLERKDVLADGGSPWRTLSQDEEKEWLDWDQLFPNARPKEGGDALSLEPTAEQAGKLRQHIDEGERGSQETSEMCWDRCAWYQPIHYFGRDFGIFIKKECVVRTALSIARFVGGPVPNGAQIGPLWRELVRASICAYFLHEQYHHKVECLGFRLHVVQNISSYLQYNCQVYKKYLGSDFQLEEALANADSFHRLSNKPYATWITHRVRNATKRYLKWEFQYAPPGYRRAVDYLNKLDFENGENLLQARVREATLYPVSPAADWDLAPRMLQSFFPVTSSIWLVSQKGAQNALPITFV